MTGKNTTTDAVEIMNHYFVKGDPEEIKRLEEEDVKFDISLHIYNLRTSGGQTQEEFGEIVGVSPRIIDDLEEADYQGDSLAMLAHIEKALWPHVSALSFPTKEVYPNALIGTTLTGLRLRCFRYLPHRQGTDDPTAAFTTFRFNVGTLHGRQYTLAELVPWLHALKMNRQELNMFALAKMKAWSHLAGGLLVKLSGDPSEYIRAVDTHTQLIRAAIHFLETGERTALKQWQQDMGPQEEARYRAELERALSAKAFEALPDTEWLTHILIECTSLMGAVVYYPCKAGVNT